MIADLSLQVPEQDMAGHEDHAYTRTTALEGEAGHRATKIADAAGVPPYVQQYMYR